MYRYSAGSRHSSSCLQLGWSEGCRQETPEEESQRDRNSFINPFGDYWLDFFPTHMRVPFTFSPSWAVHNLDNHTRQPWVPEPCSLAHCCIPASQIHSPSLSPPTNMPLHTLPRLGDSQKPLPHPSAFPTTAGVPHHHTSYPCSCCHR